MSQARALNSTSPEPVITSESPGSTDMTNTGFFRDLPSLVIALLRAGAGLPRPQHSPVNIMWQSETFWRTSSGPQFIHPPWYVFEDNFIVSLLTNESEASRASSTELLPDATFTGIGLCHRNQRTPRSVISHHFVTLVPCSYHLSGVSGH